MAWHGWLSFDVFFFFVHSNLKRNICGDGGLLLRILRQCDDDDSYMLAFFLLCDLLLTLILLPFFQFMHCFLLFFFSFVRNHETIQCEILMWPLPILYRQKKIRLFFVIYIKCYKCKIYFSSKVLHQFLFTTMYKHDLKVFL